MEIEATDAEKPDGWLDDEENLIPDPDAEKPEDWWVKFSKTLKIQTPTFRNTPYNSFKFDHNGFREWGRVMNYINYSL